MQRVELKAASSEVEGARLGDARLEKRALKVADTLAMAPAESFPTLAADDSEFEALYRFLNNERVTAERLLEPHYRATAGRAKAAGRVLVIHDTTGFTFGGETRRKGLGRMKSGAPNASQGFYAHLALVAAVESGCYPARSMMALRPV